MNNKIYFIITHLFFINTVLLAQYNVADYIYHDKILGIDFQTDFGKENYKNSMESINIDNWSNFSLHEKNLFFKYPSYLKFKSRYFPNNKEICDSVYIFTYYSNVDSASHYVFSFYQTKEDFDDVAFNSGFDTSTSIYNTYNDPPPPNERKPLWVTDGRTGLMEADSIIGKNWNGLIGKNSIGIDIGSGIGLGDKTQIFLILKRTNECNIVFDCYYDSETKCDFSEHDFFKIVEIFYENYNHKK
jgi:hypothetical protein